MAGPSSNDSGWPSQAAGGIRSGAIFFDMRAPACRFASPAFGLAGTPSAHAENRPCTGRYSGLGDAEACAPLGSHELPYTVKCLVSFPLVGSAIDGRQTRSPILLIR